MKSYYMKLYKLLYTIKTYQDKKIQDDETFFLICKKLNSNEILIMYSFMNFNELMNNKNEIIFL